MGIVGGAVLTFHEPSEKPSTRWCTHLVALEHSNSLVRKIEEAQKQTDNANHAYAVCHAERKELRSEVAFLKKRIKEIQGMSTK